MVDVVTIKQRVFMQIFLLMIILIFTGCTQPSNDIKSEEPPIEIIFDYPFNTPTWDATYIKDNIMDQFTAGLHSPDFPKFNISSDDPKDSRDPPTYWRLGSLNTYEYTNKVPYTTDWNPGDLIERALSPVPVEPNSTFSHIISPEFIIILPQLDK